MLINVEMIKIMGYTGLFALGCLVAIVLCCLVAIVMGTVAGSVVGYILGFLLDFFTLTLNLAEKKPKKYAFLACVFLIATGLGIYVILIS